MDETDNKGGDLLASRREKYNKLIEKGINPYPNRFQRSHNISDAIEFFEAKRDTLSPDSKTDEVKVAGRIVALRIMGNATFVKLQDDSGQIQLLLKRDILGDDYSIVRDLDLGDFLGSTGPLFLTRTGEILLNVRI